MIATLDAARRGVLVQPERCQLAAAKITAVAWDPRFSPALQKQLAKIKPVAKGPDLQLDAVPLFEKPELAGELTKAITAAVATP